jgi:hypothetical protein
MIKVRAARTVTGREVLAGFEQTDLLAPVTQLWTRQSLLHAVEEIRGNSNVGVRYQLDIESLIGIKIEINLDPMVFVDAVLKGFLDSDKAMLASNNLERMSGIVGSCILRNNIAEGSPGCSILFHSLECNVVLDNLAVCPILRLFLRI